MADHQVRLRSWVRASDAEMRTGMLGYLSVFYGSLVIDGIVLRRAGGTAEARFMLSWPARTDRAGRRHAYARPADDTARRAIEREILGQLTEHVEVDS